MSAVAPLAAAQMESMMGPTMSETLTLPAGEYKAYGASLSPSTPLTFSVRVTSGGAVDVYMFDATGYADYKDPMATTFQYYVSGTEENTMSFSGTFRPTSTQTYYMVVDNAPISSTGAMGTNSVTVDVSASYGAPGISPFVWVGLAVAVVIVVAVVVVVLSIRRKRRQAAQAPPAPPPWAGTQWGAPPGQAPPTTPTDTTSPPTNLPPPPPGP